MLIKRVNHKRNYVLDINFKQWDGVSMIKTRLCRACPPGKHGSETLNVVPQRLGLTGSPGWPCVVPVCMGENCIHTLHD